MRTRQFSIRCLSRSIEFLLVRYQLLDLYPQVLAERRTKVLTFLLGGPINHSFFIQRENSSLEKHNKFLASRTRSDRNLT